MIIYFKNHIYTCSIHSYSVYITHHFGNLVVLKKYWNGIISRYTRKKILNYFNLCMDHQKGSWASWNSWVLDLGVEVYNCFIVNNERLLEINPHYKEFWLLIQYQKEEDQSWLIPFFILENDRRLDSTWLLSLNWLE